AQNYPNPVRGATTIVFAVPEDTHARLLIYDVRGAVVRRLWEGPAAGGHKLTWDGAADDGTPLPPGVYFYRLEAAGRTATRKMVRGE
ncbi:MAG: T9SS type A sorting domain-containing protein, partial [Candidatus Coatesbacteria bacterium]